VSEKRENPGNNHLPVTTALKGARLFLHLLSQEVKALFSRQQLNLLHIFQEGSFAAEKRLS